MHVKGKRIEQVPILADPLLRNSLTLTLAIGVLNGSSWIYHFLMSRALGIEGYGSLSALISLLFVLSVPFNTVQMGFSAFVSRALSTNDDAAIRRVLPGFLRLLFLLGGALLAIISAGSGWLTRTLALPSQVPLLLTGSAIVWWTLLPPLRGVMQGTLNVRALGTNIALEGVVKVTAGLMLVSFGLGLNGAVAGISIGGLGALALALASLRPWLHHADNRQNIVERHMILSLLPYALSLTCFAILTQSDVLFVKAFFSQNEAGLYAAASTASKIVLYTTAAIPMVMLPQAVKEHAAIPGSVRALKRSVLVSGLVGAAVVTLFFASPRPVIWILFGRSFLPAAPLLGMLSFAMLAYALALLGVYYHLATGRVAALKKVLLLVIVFPATVWLSRQSLETVTHMMVIFAILTLAGVWWSIIRNSDLKASFRSL